MFLANVHHETGGLTIIEEAPERRSVYCDRTKPYGCPAGEHAYYGRGPIQLSWNYNYEAMGLLDDPGRVARDPATAWDTAAWFWHTLGSVNSFGQTIRAINGRQECGGRQPGLVASRIAQYRRISDILGTEPGNNLSC
jgi:predicted chitinase